MFFRPRSWIAYLTNFTISVRKNCYGNIASILIDTPFTHFRFDRISDWQKPHTSEMGYLYAQCKQFYVYCGRISFGINLPYRIGDIGEWNHLKKLHAK